MAGQCVIAGECALGTADCSTEPGCERLDTADNCGACGRDDCEAGLHTSPDCSNPQGCLPPMCDVGYANCERSELDCEAAYGSSCWPDYSTSHFYSLHLVLSAAVYGGDGSLFLVGGFAGSEDFDPSPGTDIKDGGPGSLFVTKLNADSTYGWTRLIAGAASADGSEGSTIVVTDATVSATGSLLLSGEFESVVDFDPGPGTANAGVDGAHRAYVLSLATDGSFGWVRTWADSGVADAVVGASGVIYVAGIFDGSIDLDPGPGVDSRTSDDGGYLVKLTDAGDYVWGRLGTPCSSLRVAADESIWCLTYAPGYLAAFEADGAERPLQLEIRDLDSAKLATSGEHIYLAGAFPGLLEVTDGETELVRVTPNSYAGALLTLDLDGKLVGARQLPEPLADVAAAPDGVLALDALGGVFADYADGVPKLRFTAAVEGAGSLLASSPTEFAVIGEAAEYTDVNPGPQMTSPAARSLFVSRFRF